MGFGYSIAVTQLMLAAVLWQIGTIARANALSVRPVIVVIMLAVVAAGVIAWHFIFPVPALFSLLQIASLGVAYVMARGSQRAAGQGDTGVGESMTTGNQ